jgi:hypothetical protein
MTAAIAATSEALAIRLPCGAIALKALKDWNSRQACIGIGFAAEAISPRHRLRLETCGTIRGKVADCDLQRPY